MKESEIKALIRLLDDEDQEVLVLIEAKVKELGSAALPYLEEAFFNETTEESFRERIGQLVQLMKQQSVQERLITWKNDGAKDLLEGLWIVASFQYPDLKLEDLRSEIKRFKLETWLEFRENMHPYDQVKAINHTFFTKLNFTANTKSFHATNNSMINQVFEQRLSNPIGLCCVYMLIAQELSLPIYGVNLPNVFVLTYKQPNIQFYINVFSRGVILTKIEIENHIKQLNLEPQDAFFEPCGNLTIIQRVLRNLIVSFEKVQDVSAAKQTEALLRAIINTKPLLGENRENEG
jgi:regulator of sirC expression with transglutaminase-like and TPR domain